MNNIGRNNMIGAGNKFILVSKLNVSIQDFLDDNFSDVLTKTTFTNPTQREFT